MRSWESLQDEDGQASVCVLSRLLSHFKEARHVWQRWEDIQG